jgi:hypothetical protein
MFGDKPLRKRRAGDRLRFVAKLEITSAFLPGAASVGLAHPPYRPKPQCPAGHLGFLRLRSQIGDALRNEQN